MTGGIDKVTASASDCSNLTELTNSQINQKTYLNMSLSLLSASSWYFSQIYFTKNTGERIMQLTPEFENKRG